MELIPGLWSTLPPELLERVLLFLPVPYLCRYRSVCKKWNSLICTPEFGTLYIENASHNANRGACLVVKLRRYARRTGRLTEMPTWSIFDFDARRWYNVKNELPEGYDYDARAMDAGLVCTFVNAFTEEQRQTSTIRNSMTNKQPQVLIVSNLFGKTIKVLPNPPLPKIDLPWTNLGLVVDNTSSTYKVYLIFVGCFWKTGDRCMCLYESSTNQWRVSSNPPNPARHPVKFDDDVRSVVFQGLLYVLLAHRIGRIRLYRYNFVEDAWDDTGVKLPKEYIFMIDMCDLVVSDNRLFLTIQCLIDRNVRDQRMECGDYDPWDISPWPLHITEILVAENTCRTVVQITNGQVMRQFDSGPTDRSEFKIRAYGFDKSILLMTENIHGETGKYMLYDLVTGSWEFLPPNPAERLYYPRGYNGAVSRHGMRMSYLCLPNTPWG